MKRYKQTYNDGLAEIKRDASADNTYQNPESADDLTHVVDLPYEEATIRTEDLEFLQDADITETVKIKVPQCGMVKAGMYAVIRGTLYYIYQADPNRALQNVYLYMREARHG